MSRNKVLIVTSSSDETVKYITKKYESVSDFFLVSVDLFDQYEFIVDNQGWSISSNTGIVSNSEIQSIYYRKPILPDLNVFEERYHLMIQRDIISLINGIVDSFDGTVLTKPYILRKTENKIMQLIYARNNEWAIPKSFIGNVNSICDDFSKGESIIKPISSGRTHGEKGWELYPTRLFNQFNDDVRLTPVYLQEYVHKKYEVRLTVIDDNYYAVRIDTEDKVDWRMDYSKHVYSLIECPKEIKEKCCHLMDAFKLHFGAFDFIVTPEDKWIFLEVNPNGQWLWLEKALDLNISKNIIDYLLR